MIISQEAVSGTDIGIRIPDVLSAYNYGALRSKADIEFIHNVHVYFMDNVIAAQHHRSKYIVRVTKVITKPTNLINFGLIFDALGGRLLVLF